MAMEYLIADLFFSPSRKHESFRTRSQMFKRKDLVLTKAQMESYRLFTVFSAQIFQMKAL